MKWTSEKPSVPGWYWWHDVDRPGTPCIVQVISDGYGLTVYGLEEYSRRLYETHGEWAGPLTEPEEETK